MSDLTIAETLKYANLQMAAEAFLVNNDGSIRQDLVKALTDGNLHASRFTEPQADDFLNQWTVVSQQIDTTTGFSGTLFKAIKDNPSQNIKAGDLVLSFRSTEFIDDAVRDGKATNELEIKDTGFAWGQISDMQSWYASLVDRGLVTDPAGNPAQVTVTGYSLGGHLATVFNLLHGDEVVNQVVNFNGAGIGTVDTGYTLQGQLTKSPFWQSNSSLITEKAITNWQMSANQLLWEEAA